LIYNDIFFYFWLCQKTYQQNQLFIAESKQRLMREKWTTQDGSPCGSKKFKGVKKCRPTVRISKETPVTWQELKAKRKATEAVREKQRVGMGKRTKAIRRD